MKITLVKLIGAGWGRTGTTSVAVALERLGVAPCLQMQEMWSHPELAALWNRHRDGEPVDWRMTLQGWQATVDWPGCWEWQDFAALWPHAPILLTVRDPDDWYESLLGSIHPFTAPGNDVGGPPPVVEILARVWDEDFGGWERVFDRGHTIAAFLKHNEGVRAKCPPDRLVEWSVADGWGPLCAALGAGIPDEPFPHVNRR